MELVKSVSILYYLQKISLIRTCHFTISPNGDIVVKEEKGYHLYVFQLFTIWLLLYYTTYTTRSHTTFIIYTMKMLLKFCETIIPGLIYASDIVVANKIASQYKRMLRIDGYFKKNIGKIRYQNIKSFIWKTLLLISICVTLKLIFYLKSVTQRFQQQLLSNITTILISVMTLRWMIYLYICGCYIDKLNEIILDLKSTQGSYCNIRYIHGIINSLKVIKFAYSELYQLVKNFESTLSLNISIIVCYTYMKMLFNFYVACKLLLEGKPRHFEALAYNAVHVFPLIGIVVSSMKLWKKFENVLGSFNFVMSKVMLKSNQSIYLEKLVSSR